jgi:predicted O-methyltransferase YrrM
MFSLAEIRELFNAVHRPGYGSVNDVELEFIQSLIAAQRPAIFVEIGVASGLSSGFIAKFMSENGGQVLHSIDINERFYVDPTQPTGFLIPTIYSGSSVRVALHIKKSAFDLPEILGETRFDMGFIDAHHGHPWPTIDTMLALPFAKPGGSLLHHDLSLYKQEQWKTGTGPKHLFDQLQEDEKQVISQPGENIGYVRVPTTGYRSLEPALIRSMTMPWTATLHSYFVDRLRPLLARYWGAAASDAFEEAHSRWSKENF